MDKAEKPVEATLTGFLRGYYRQHRRPLIIGVSAVVLKELFSATVPLLVRSGVNGLSNPPQMHRVFWVAAAMIGVAIPRALLQAVARLRILSVSRDVEYEMRDQLFRHLMILDPAFYSRVRSGDIMARATNDLNSVRQMFGPGLSNLVESAVTLPVAFVLLSSIDWRLTILVLVPAPFAVVLMARYGRMVRGRFQAIQGLFSNLSTFVQQHLAGIRVVRVFAQQGNEMRSFSDRNREYSKANMRLALLSSMLDPELALLMGLSVLAVLWFGGTAVRRGEMSVGSFAMFTTYVAMLLKPVTGLGRVVTIFQRGAASAQRLWDLLCEKPQILSPVPSVRVVRMAPSAPTIRFLDAGVSLGQFHPLHSINATLLPGRTIAIAGRTGAGKTTLVKLIPRIIDASKGAVEIDGTNVRCFSFHDLRAQIGFVPQESFLFSATISENIGLGNPAANPNSIRKAAELAGLSKDLSSFPEGLETVVGERGILLSGGQKQRVAIARAIIRNPRILIFDDALSSVDAITEENILNHLKELRQDRTTILVSHRLFTLRAADQLLLLEAGTLAEPDGLNELLADEGHWAELNGRGLFALEERAS